MGSDCYWQRYALEPVSLYREVYLSPNSYNANLYPCLGLNFSGKGFLIDHLEETLIPRWLPQHDERNILPSCGFLQLLAHLAFANEGGCCYPLLGSALLRWRRCPLAGQQAGFSRIANVIHGDWLGEWHDA